MTEGALSQRPLLPVAGISGTRPGQRFVSLSPIVAAVAKVEPVLPPSSKSHVKFREREGDNPLNSFTLSGNLLQAFIDRCVKILLAAPVAHPSRHVFDVNRLYFEAKPGQNAPLLHSSFAELALITFSRIHPDTRPGQRFCQLIVYRF